MSPKRPPRSLSLVFALFLLFALPGAQAWATEEGEDAASEGSVIDGEGNSSGANIGIITDAFHWNYNSGTRKIIQCINGDCQEVAKAIFTAKINLGNGRQSQWYQTSLKFSGANIKATLHWNCVDDNGIFTNTECNQSTGAWPSKADTIYRGATTFASGWIYNYHEDPATYWYEFYWTLKVSGKVGTWRWPNSGVFRSSSFQCASGVTTCNFP